MGYQAEYMGTVAVLQQRAERGGLPNGLSTMGLC